MSAADPGYISQVGTYLLMYNTGISHILCVSDLPSPRDRFVTRVRVTCWGYTSNLTFSNKITGIHYIIIDSLSGTPDIDVLDIIEVEIL